MMPKIKKIHSFSKLNPGNSDSTGFAVYEIILVAFAIVILVAIVLMALNPSHEMAEVKNYQRRLDIDKILNAVNQYSQEHNGAMPSDLSVNEKEICATHTASSTCSELGLVNLSIITDTEAYLPVVPVDPQNDSAEGSGYFIRLTENGRVSARAPLAEDGELIMMTK